MLPLDSRRQRLQQSVEGLAEPEVELDPELEALQGEETDCSG